MSSARLVIDFAYRRRQMNTVGTNIDSEAMTMMATWSWFSIGMGDSNGPMGISCSAIFVRVAEGWRFGW